MFHFAKLLVCCTVAHSAAALTPNPVLPSVQQSRSNLTALISSDEDAANCVNTGRYPIWNGRILFADCAAAISKFKLDTAGYASRLYAFYSAKNGYEPPPGPKEMEWRLPYTLSHGIINQTLFFFFNNPPFSFSVFLFSLFWSIELLGGLG